MKKLSKKILVLANNLTWTTVHQKIQDAVDFYAPVIDLQYLIINTEYKNVPLTKTQVLGNVNYTDTAIESYVVDPLWFHNNPVRLTGQSFDCVVFMLNISDEDPLTGLVPAGINTGSYNGVDQITMFIMQGSENWPAAQNGVIQGNSFSFLLKHELGHWICPLLGLPVDITHKYFYSADPSGIIKELLQAIQNNMKTKIMTWASAIQVQEGGAPTDRNMVNNNPGNIKATNYGMSLGKTIGSDTKGMPVGAKGFCIYDSYQTGFNALCQLLTDACEDNLLAYHPQMTLAQFTQVYACPPNGNYSKAIASALGVSVNTPIGSLLS